MAVFSKILSYTDVSRKFTVPSDWLGNLLPKLQSNDKATISVLDQTGRVYRFVLKVRGKKDDQPYYLKPVFQSREWLQFVRAHGLETKDTIYFWKERRGNDDIIRVQVRDPPNVQLLLGFIIAA